MSRQPAQLKTKLLSFMGLWIFVLSGLAARVICWLIMSIQTFRAATSNPADMLHCECRDSGDLEGFYS
jgi:hypothetical protein